MPNLQKKRLLIFEIFNIKKCTLCFGTVCVCVCVSHTQGNINSDILKTRTRNKVKLCKLSISVISHLAMHRQSSNGTVRGSGNWQLSNGTVRGSGN